MVIAQLITPWTGDGSSIEAAYRPRIGSVYSLHGYHDVTETAAAHIIPDPNLLVIEATLDAAVLAQIEADPAYFVIWSDDNA